MGKDKNGVVDVDKVNKKQNLAQIFLDHDIIYIIKLIAFFIAAWIISNDISVSVEQMEEINESYHIFASLVVFLMTTCIDEAILFQNCRLKSVRMRIKQAAFMIWLFVELGFVIVVLLGKCPLPWNEVVGLCHVCNFICCVSPGFELAFDLTYRVQNERDKRISEVESEDEK